VSRYLWMSASIDVLLDGRPVLRTGGQASLLGRCRSNFRRQGEAHQAELSWGKMASGAFPFILRIDGEVVLASEVPVDHWSIVVVGWTMVLAVVFLCMAAGCVGAVLFRRLI
jgi:hypothetical protein